MTDDEARKLATRMIDSWPNGPKAYVWRDILLPLDAARAAEAYRRLLTGDNGRPRTPGQFADEYAALRPIDTGSRPGYLSVTNPVGPRQHIAQLRARAERGDMAAAVELERWERLLPARQERETA